MKRWTWLVFALAVCACGKKAEPTKKHDAAPVMPTAADAVAPTIDAAFTNDVEPKSAPPAATLGKGRGDCKPDYAPKPTRDPNPMCKVTGGTFMMGTNDKEFPKAQPAHAVKLDSFRIDRYEVTVAQVVFYLNTVKDNHCPGVAPDSDECFGLGGDPEQLVLKDGAFAAGAGMERMPMFKATVVGAERYCAWAGKRLVTDAQWEYAARHDPKTNKDYAYPWGDKFEKNRTNCGDDCADEFQRLAPVGSFDGTNGRGDDSSPFGVHDTAGNADEITATCFEPYKACTGPCPDEPSTKPGCERVLRYATFAGDKATIQTFVRGNAMTEHSGFRCAAPL